MIEMYIGLAVLATMGLIFAIIVKPTHHHSN
jgi:hypothetical protein